MRVVTTVDIDAPIEGVWPLLDKDENIKLWMPDVIETTYPDGKPEGDPVGTRFEQKISEGGRVKPYLGEVTAYEPRRLLCVRLGDERNFSTDVTYRLSAKCSGTRLDYACDVRLFGRHSRVMILIGGPMMRRIVKRQMANLKRVAEKGGGA
jgi:uncharacterized protein YndB with AHSA1/START domain